MSQTNWNIDPVHSEIGFKVKHMMFTTVSGRFDKFTANVETTGDDFSTAKINFSAETESVNTNNADRDKHLKTGDFFLPEQYPNLTFTSTSIQKVSEDKYIVKGNMTIRDVSKEIELDADYSGLMKDPWGQTRAAFTLNSKINRKDFGLNWNAALEAGGVLVSDEVKILCDIQLIKAQA